MRWRERGHPGRQAQEYTRCAQAARVEPEQDSDEGAAAVWRLQRSLHKMSRRNACKMRHSNRGGGLRVLWRQAQAAAVWQRRGQSSRSGDFFSPEASRRYFSMFIVTAEASCMGVIGRAGAVSEMAAVPRRQQPLPSPSLRQKRQVRPAAGAVYAFSAIQLPGRG